jgi:predicted esterase
MGGMAALELIASAPELFASAAIVAGYLRPSTTIAVTKALARTPTMVVHSRSDRTCPWQDMATLVDDVAALGGQLVTWYEVKGSHEEAFKRAYVDTSWVFDWLFHQRHTIAGPA